MKVTLRRSGTHHYIFLEEGGESLHFPPLGDSHPAYWPARREILEEARKVLLQENNSLPHRGNVEASSSNEGLVALVQEELQAQLRRQHAAQLEEEEAEVEAYLDRLGY